MMEINPENNEKEKKFSIANLKKKIKEKKEKRKEDKEDKQREKEELARVQEEEKKKTVAENSAFKDITITNDIISKKSLKNAKPILTPQEERQRKRKRKKFIRNIMTIPEIIIVILLALFLKNKYIKYSQNVHQVLTYTSNNYVYEIHRDNDNVKVMKNYRENCPVAPCEIKNVSEYEIKFEKNEMRTVRVFLDLQFKFKSGNKTVTIDDMKTDFGKKCIYSMVHNSPSFLSYKAYNKYTIIDYEQMSSYTTRGFKYEVEGDKKTLNIAMGERPTSGYALVVNTAYKKGDDIYFYIKEQTPEAEGSSMALVTHPLVKIELQETPKNIYVYNVDSGEEYPNYDAPATPQQSIVMNRKELSKDIVKGLRDALLQG